MVDSNDHASKVLHRVDFADPNMCSGSDPVSCSINNTQIPFEGNWRDLLVAISEYCISEFQEKTDSLKSTWYSHHSSIPYMLNEKPRMTGKKLNNGYWINVHYSISQIILVITGLCRYCGMSLDDIEIKYAPKTKTQKLTRTMTVKEAVLKVLSHTKQSMTVKEIYDEIIKQGLYTFGAKNPINILRKVIESACDNTGFSEKYRVTTPSFHSEMKGDGKRVYSIKTTEGIVDKIMPQNVNDARIITVPDSILNVLLTDYSNGFRFDATALRLLSNKAGVEIDNTLQSELKRILFRRSDGVYFAIDAVASIDTLNNLIEYTNALLEEFGCFEISEVYRLYADKMNAKCISNVDVFEDFYGFINNRDDVRIAAIRYIRNKVARLINWNAWDLLNEVAKRITKTLKEDFCGTATEEEMHKLFRAFSVDLLAKIIKYCADDILRTEINGIIVYQTLETLGLIDEFSQVLAETLEKLCSIGISPSEDNLHTALSLAIGVNFKSEYNIPDAETYRRLIDAYYKAEPPRKWKGGIFSEVSD